MSVLCLLQLFPWSFPHKFFTMQCIGHKLIHGFYHDLDGMTALRK